MSLLSSFVGVGVAMAVRSLSPVPRYKKRDKFRAIAVCVRHQMKGNNVNE